LFRRDSGIIRREVLVKQDNRNGGDTKTGEFGEIE
jgi:hypothetical protein